METKSSGGLFLNFAKESISNLTKDNVRKKLNIISYLKFILIFLKFFSLSRLKNIFRFVFKSLNKKWYRALFLDFF